jgi:hypothetical protein
VADPNLDTASQRSPTGMDRNARGLIMGALGIASRTIVDLFLRDRYLDLWDYRNAVEEVWGEEIASVLGVEMASTTNMQSTMSSQQEIKEAVGEVALRFMPEPDFRLAIVEAARSQLPRLTGAESRIKRICKNRGVLWDFTLADGFTWIGDSEVERQAIRPALSAIADPRFAGATKSEFDQARAELALGTPIALKQSVHESGCAVESAMKVVLTECGYSHKETDTARPLFEGLVEAGIVPGFMERIILGASSPRNKRGGHGAGDLPHDVPQAMAEAALASAAVAIAYLHSRLR